MWTAATTQSTDSVAALGAAATGVAALIALVVGIATIIQRSRADKRAEWWRRSQWAIDQANSADARTRETGLTVLLHLLESELATADERRLLRDVGLNLIRRLAGRP